MYCGAHPDLLAPDANALVSSLHGMLLRASCRHLGQHQQGLSAAARALFKVGAVDARLKTKLINIDITFQLVRHITEESVRDCVDAFCSHVGSSPLRRAWHKSSNGVLSDSFNGSEGSSTLVSGSGVAETVSDSSSTSACQSSPLCFDISAEVCTSVQTDVTFPPCCNIVSGWAAGEIVSNDVQNAYATVKLVDERRHQGEAETLLGGSKPPGDCATVCEVDPVASTVAAPVQTAPQLLLGADGLQPGAWFKAKLTEWQYTLPALKKQQSDWKKGKGNVVDVCSGLEISPSRIGPS